MVKEDNGIINIDLDSLDLNETIEVNVANEYKVAEIPKKDTENDLEGTEKNISTATEDKDKDDLIEINEEQTEKQDEEEIDDKKKADDKDTMENTESQDESESPLTPYASFALLLSEKGVLQNISVDEENFKDLGEEEQLEVLVRAVDSEIVDGITSYIESLPPRLQKAIGNYNEGVPLEDIVRLDSNRIKYSNINEEDMLKNEDTMKRIIVEDKISRGMTREEAESEVLNIVELEKAAKPALKRLKVRSDKEEEEIKKNKAAEIKNSQEEMQKRYNDYIKNVDYLVNKTNEVIPGIKLNKTTKENITKMMIKPIGYDSKGNPVTTLMKARSDNPLAFDFNVHYVYEITKGFTDWSKIINTATTNSTKKFMNSLNSKTKKTGGKPLQSESERDARTEFLESLKIFK